MKRKLYKVRVQVNDIFIVAAKNYQDAKDIVAAEGDEIAEEAVYHERRRKLGFDLTLLKSPLTLDSLPDDWADLYPWGNNGGKERTCAEWLEKGA